MSIRSRDITGNESGRLSRRLSAVEAVPQPYGWKAREFLPGPDIYYNRARFYDPVLGRFISEDPLGYEGGDTNLYAFTWNNPRNWSDPSGLSAAGEYGGTGGSAARNSSGILNAGLRVKCVFETISDVFDMMEKERLGTADQVLLGASLVTCAATVGPKPKPRPPKPDTCSIGGAVGGLVSFEAGTLIETENGSIKIEDVKIGDSVAARDEFSGTTVYRPVTNLFRRTAPRIVHLSLDAPNGKREVMKVTSEHPFFVKGRGWTEVRKLVPGDQIISGKGGFLAIANMRSESNPTLVYNFEVAQNHNYFVGEEGALAHNARIPKSIRKKIFDSIDGICPTCKIKMVFTGPQKGPRTDRFSCDHFDPQSKGGSDDEVNLRGLCVPCNSRKGNR